jgi:hypothetical protein
LARRVLLLGVIMVTALGSGCRCTSSTRRPDLAEELGSGEAAQARSPAARREARRRAVQMGGARQLAARFARRPSLLLGERLKCARMRERLVVAGAQVRLPTSIALPALSKQAALISFVQHRRKLYRFVRWRGRTRPLAALPLERVDPLLVGLRDELEFGKLGMRKLTTYLRRAYDRLLADALPAGAKKLLFAPDGLARFIPLHALLAPVRGGGGKLEFVVSRAAVAYLPCAGLARRYSGKAGGLTLVAPSYGPASARRPLAGARQELEAITALARRDKRALTSLTGAKATPEALIAALARPGEQVHFAGHGLADLRPGSPPELIFPGRETGLSVRRLTRGRLGASLVLLASCTGAYVARFRDGRRLLAEVNLAEALLAGGVSTVVASSWSVKDKQSAAQMRLFHQRLPRLGAARALAAAQRERIARLRPPHPRFWAFYAVYGAPGW